MDLPNHRRLFRILAVLVGLLPVGVLELGARAWLPREATWRDSIVDVSGQADLFVRGPGEATYSIDPARHNFFRPDGFATEKTDRTRRVFVLGGSSVQGRPYAIETAISTWLRLLLSASDPAHDYEVVNGGGISYASYRVAKILDEVLRYQPDAIVIYTGHNEFLEDRTYASRRSKPAITGVIDSIADRSRLVGFVRRHLGRTEAMRQTLAPEVSARLDHLGGLDDYVRDPQWRTGVEADFRLNLIAMVQRCRDANVPLVLCVPASDVITTPPFKTTVDPALSADQRATCGSAWRQILDEPAGTATATNLATILDLDPGHAGVHFILGRRAIETGDLDQAVRHLTTARDDDVCPLRATSTIERHVREVAAEYAVPLVDVPMLFDDDGNGIHEPKWFVDHVHPSVAGHQRIARAIGDVFATMGWIELNETTSSLFDEAASRHLSALGEEYFVRGRQRLKGLQQWAAGRAGIPTSSNAKQE